MTSPQLHLLILILYEQAFKSFACSSLIKCRIRQRAPGLHWCQGDQTPGAGGSQPAGMAKAHLTDAPRSHRKSRCSCPRAVGLLQKRPPLRELLSAVPQFSEDALRVLWLASISKFPVCSQRWLEEEIINWNKILSCCWNISLSSEEANQPQSFLPKEHHRGTSSYKMVALQLPLNTYWFLFCVSVDKTDTLNHKHF